MALSSAALQALFNSNHRTVPTGAYGTLDSGLASAILASGGTIPSYYTDPSQLSPAVVGATTPSGGGAGGGSGRDTPGAGNGLGGGYAPPGSDGSGGATPDLSYLSDPSWLLGHDSIYAQAMQNYQAQLDADKANLSSVLNQLLINYGFVPDLGSIASKLGISGDNLGALLGALDPHTAALAQENTKAGTSILGRLGNANSVANASITGALAGRGLLDSGDAGFRLGQQNLRYSQGMYDAFQSLMKSIGGGEQSYATDVNKIMGQETSAADQAYQRQLQQIINAGGAASPGGGSTGGSADTSGSSQTGGSTSGSSDTSSPGGVNRPVVAGATIPPVINQAGQLYRSGTTNTAA